MTNQNRIDLELIDRYLAGESSPAGQARVRDAAESDPRIRELIATLPAATRSPEAMSWDTDRAWAQLQAGERGDKPARKPRKMPWLRLAAVLLVGLALVVVGRSCIGQSASASKTHGQGRRPTDSTIKYPAPALALAPAPYFPSQ